MHKISVFWTFLVQNWSFVAKPLAEFRPKFAKRCVSKSWTPNQSIKFVTLSEKKLWPKNLFFTPVLYNKDNNMSVCNICVLMSVCNIYVIVCYCISIDCMILYQCKSECIISVYSGV